MLRTGMTKSDAAHEWVREFNAIKTDMIDKLMRIEPEDWQEVTVPAIGDRVYLYDECIEGEIVDIGDDDRLYAVEADSGNIYEASEGDFEVIRDDALPMWGTMWSFGDSLDDWWVEHDVGLQAMSDCGFRIYYNEEFGYFFGIDGAGYDFYESHWIPLYEKRGLKWHDDSLAGD